MMHRYPPATARRIKAITPGLKTITMLPDPFLRLEQASFFFVQRPSDRTIQTTKTYRSLRTQIVSVTDQANGKIYRVRATTRKDISRFIAKMDRIPEGLFLTRDACKALGVTPNGSITPAWDVDLKLDAGTISWILSMKDWTGLPYFTLSARDLI